MAAFGLAVLFAVDLQHYGATKLKTVFGRKCFLDAAT